MALSRTVRSVVIWVGDRDHVEFGDSGKVRRIAGVEGEVVGQCCRGDERVVGARCRLPAGAAQLRCDPTERAGGRGIERDRVKVRLGLLEMCLPRRPNSIIAGNQRAYRQFCQCDRADECLIRKWRGRGESAK
jgi:hypothetical protein